jgi:drug/metabolite transporter (DMT)-like permease
VTQQPRAYAAWIVVCLVWGTTYVAIRIAIETIPPLLMTSARWVAAGGLLLAVLRLRGESLPARSAWTSLALVGMLLVGVGNGAIVLAEQVVPSGLTAVLLAVTPFWMVGIEWFLPNAMPLSGRHVVGLLVGFGGVVFLVWPELRADSGAPFLLGVAATQLGCLGWAAGSNYARQRETDRSMLGASALQMVFGGLFLLVVAVVRGEAMTQATSARSLEAMLYLIFVGSIVGFSAYAYALKHLPLSFVSLYAYITPVIAVVLGTIILNEPITPRLLIASAVVLAGVAIVRR